jgi:hypothetical protein
MDKRVQVLSAARVQDAFLKLGLPFRFSDIELEKYQSAPTGLPDASMLCFPTPESNSGLNLLNLRKLLGVDPAHPPSFFDHPWYLEEAFGHTNCAPGWHVIETSVRPESQGNIVRLVPWGGCWRCGDTDSRRSRSDALFILRSFR